MTHSQYKIFYPEACLFLEYLRDPKVIKQTQETLDAIPAWKEQFLSGYNLPDTRDMVVGPKTGGRTG